MVHTHVDSQLAEIGVELTREPQASSDSGHNNRDEVVEIAVCWCRKLQGAEADIVESLVIDTESLIRVFYQLVNGEGGIVWL